MARANKPKKRKIVCQPGQVPVSVQSLAGAAQQLAIARDRLITIDHVTTSLPDQEAFSEEFVAGWKAAMNVVKSAVAGELTLKVTPQADDDKVNVYPTQSTPETEEAHEDGATAN